MLAEVLVCVALCGQRVGCAIAVANDLTGVLLWVAHLELKELTFCRTLDEFAFEFVACSNFADGNVIEVWHGAVHNNLQGGSTAAIGQFDEGEVFAAHSCGACPAGHLDDMIDKLLVVVDEGLDSDAFAVRKDCRRLFLDWSVALELELVVTFVAGVFGSHLLLLFLCLFYLLGLLLVFGSGSDCLLFHVVQC